MCSANQSSVSLCIFTRCIGIRSQKYHIGSCFYPNLKKHPSKGGFPPNSKKKIKWSARRTRAVHLCIFRPTESGPEARNIRLAYVLTETSKNTNKKAVFRQIRKKRKWSARRTRSVYLYVLWPAKSEFENRNLRLACVSSVTSNVDFFPENLGDFSEERGKRFHQDLKDVVRRYQGMWNKHIMADYYWMLAREIPERKRKCEKQPLHRSFENKRSRYHEKSEWIVFAIHAQMLWSTLMSNRYKK